MMKKQTKLFQVVRTYAIIVCGTLIMALSLNIFLIPNKIVTGGASGIGTILYYATGIGAGTWMLIINIPLFFAGFKALGKHSMIRTSAATVLLSLFTDITDGITLQSFDPVISSVYGGAMMGCGIGIIFLTSSATGGSDLAVKQLEKRFSMLSSGQLLLVIDAVIIISSAFVFKNYNAALYGFLSLYISGVLIDIITGGVNFAKAVYIISGKHEDIKRAVTGDLDRGVTVIDASGGYTGRPRPILFCVITKGEVVRLKAIVKNTDPNAFVIITDAKEVMGEGFYRT